MTGVSTNSIQFTVIVPILNEISLLPQFVLHINNQWYSPQELIIVDGGSTDGSWEWLQNNPSIRSYQSRPGRACQMNYGAEKAGNAWLYFVHVDSKLPENFDLLLTQAIKKGAQAGCFQLKFDRANWILRCAANGSRWNHILCRGGDQSLFIDKNTFEQLGGYDPRYLVCEDIHFIRKLYRKGGFYVLPQRIQTSSRRFYENGVFRLLFHFGALHLSHWLGADPKFLQQYYVKYIS